MKLRPCVAPEPDAAVAFSRFLESCEQYVDAFPPQAARAFVLSEVLGHTAEEVSNVLGSVSNVWVTTHRTGNSLRMSLESARPV
ncbi:MAG: hypothetical protein C5B46_09695 [Proteobacteria bacterium]|nr:MAG: hypothetical protein C5B46_09695 [Pseudomonadota bacterium]